IRDLTVTGVQTCALPILSSSVSRILDIVPSHFRSRLSASGKWDGTISRIRDTELDTVLVEGTVDDRPACTPARSTPTTCTCEHRSEGRRVGKRGGRRCIP